MRSSSTTARFETSAQDETIGFRTSASLEGRDQDARVVGAVRSAQAGDMEAIRFLYVRYKDNIYGYV
ncbi:MAG: hypothetical protein ACRDLV_01835, partial [Solirubrobacteraceae bacterium]